MWIVAKDKGPLREADAYVNLVAHGNGSEYFPTYVGLTEETILTSIIYPLVHDGGRIGVINLESTDRHWCRVCFSQSDWSWLCWRR